MELQGEVGAQIPGVRVHDDLAREAAERQEALSVKLKAETAEAEARIDAAKAEAIANIGSVAVDVARAATAKLISSDISSADAEAAVADALRERS